MARTRETGEPCTRVSAFTDVGILSGDERVEFLISTRKQDDVVKQEIEEAAETDETDPASAPARKNPQSAVSGALFTAR
ncbi:MAG: hypothetical protein ABIF77_01425 [bacterium]